MNRALTIPRATAGSMGAMAIMAGTVVVTPDVVVVTPPVAVVAPAPPPPGGKVGVSSTQSWSYLSPRSGGGRAGAGGARRRRGRGRPVPTGWWRGLVGSC